MFPAIIGDMVRLCRIGLAFLYLATLLSGVQAAEDRAPGLYARLETSMGTIIVKLFEKEAPITVANFVELAQGKKEWTDPVSGEKVKRPLYDGTIFHRVIPKFMIQGGDPSGAGAGNTGFTIPDEIVPDLKFDRPGRLAMANSGPNTGSCQFFLTEVPTPHIDGAHTIFGQVVDGQNVISLIGTVQLDADDKPVKPVKINRVVIERVGEEPETK